MRKYLAGLGMRQRVLLMATGATVMAAIALQGYVFPAYDRMTAARAQCEAQAAELATLEANMAVSGVVDRQFMLLNDVAFQDGSDQTVLSDLLRDLEALARLPGMAIVNIRPLAVEDEGTHKIYRVKLAVSGPLQAVLAFVGAVTKDSPNTGIESFSLRGRQVRQEIECSLCIRMIRLPRSGIARKEAKRD